MVPSPSDSSPTRTPAARSSWPSAKLKPSTPSRSSAKSSAPPCPSSTPSLSKKSQRIGKLRSKSKTPYGIHSVRRFRLPPPSTFPRSFDLFQRPSARLRHADEKDNRDV